MILSHFLFFHVALFIIFFNQKLRHKSKMIDTASCSQMRLISLVQNIKTKFIASPLRVLNFICFHTLFFFKSLFKLLDVLMVSLNSCVF